MGKIIMTGVAVVLLAWVVGCQPSVYYVPQTQDEAYEAMRKSGSNSYAPVDRVAWADAALRSPVLDRWDRADAWYNRGLANYDMSQYEDSADDLDEAIALDREFGEAYAARGNALYMLGYYADAIDDYDQAFRLTGESIYRQYARETQRDWDQGLPPPYLEEWEEFEERSGGGSYRLDITGIKAVRLQEDAVFDPGNEAYFQITFNHEGRTWTTQVPSGAYYKFVRNNEWAMLSTGRDLPAGQTRITVRGYEDDRDEDMGIGGTDSLGSVTFTADTRKAGTNPDYYDGRAYHYRLNLRQGGAEYVLLFRVNRR